jgi:hypothetical protein
VQEDSTAYSLKCNISQDVNYLHQGITLGLVEDRWVLPCALSLCLPYTQYAANVAAHHRPNCHAHYHVNCHAHRHHISCEAGSEKAAEIKAWPNALQ